MDNTTPPKWAIELGRTIAYDFGEPRYQEAGYGIAQSIDASAPDAEALAVALEKMLYMDGSHKHCNDTCHYKQCEKVLLSYRSRFPKE